MDDERLLITPQTKIGELLDAYPQLEEVLVEVAPAFKKLRSPILRKTVAKVTSLAQAARVGGVSAIELVGRLRREVGQPKSSGAETGTPAESYPAERPLWYDESRIAQRLDARAMIDSGEQPIGQVLRDLDKLQTEQIYELVTPFEPAPLIDKAKGKGFLVWVRVVNKTEFHTYFRKG